MVTRTMLPKTIKRFKNALIATAFVATQLFVPLSASNVFGATAAADKPTDDNNNKVTICHRTNSTTNPYTVNSVDFDSTTGDLKDQGNSDHTSHTGPVWDANTVYPAPHNGDQWGDIIPPYTWDGGGSYAGLNWTTAGQAIWNNGCEPVDSTTPADPTATAESSTCVEEGDSDGEVTVSVTNTADQTGAAASYDVTLGGVTKNTGSIADGASGSVTFTGLAVGDYTATITGSDVTSTTVDVTVAECANESVTLCHATGSESNPYELIKVNASGAYHGHYTQHEDDIIPTFTYKGQTYSLNWNDDGQAIFRNDCSVPEQSTEVTPEAPTFVDPTCENNMGSYTIPEEEGVIYKVEGQVVAAGVYQAVKGTSVTITAEAAEGYVLKDGATTSWSYEFTIKTGCVIGDNDVCPNIIGSQTEVPDGYTKNAAGNCVKPGKVLGSSTELPKTGANTLFAIIAGTAFIALAIGTRFANRSEYIKS